MIKQYCLLVFLLLPLFSFDQTDSLQKKKTELFPNHYGDKKWKFILGLDARRSFFAGNPVKINGLKLGAEFKGVHRFGLGFYWLQSNLIFQGIPVDQPDAQQPTEVRFDLNYTSLFYERVFLKTRWWEIAFPLHLGGGSISAEYRVSPTEMKLLLKKPFSALLMSTQVKFYPLKWLALRISGGYRFNFNTDTEIKNAFNRPFYGFGISINLIDLYHGIKLRNEIRKHKKENLRSD